MISPTKTNFLVLICFRNLFNLDIMQILNFHYNPTEESKNHENVREGYLQSNIIIFSKNNIIKKIVENPSIKTDNALEYTLRKHGMKISNEELRKIVGPKIWFNYFFISHHHHSSLNHYS